MNTTLYVKFFIYFGNLAGDFAGNLAGDLARIKYFYA